MASGRSTRTALHEAEPPKFVAPSGVARDRRGRHGAAVDARRLKSRLWLGHKTHLVHYPVRAGRRSTSSPSPLARWNETRLERAGLAGRSDGAISRRAMVASCARSARHARAVAEMGAGGTRRCRATGAATRSRCSAMPRIRCCRSWRRARRWRSRMPPCWHGTWPQRPDDPAGAMRLYEHDRRARTARCSAPRARTAESISIAAPTPRCATS